MKCEGCGLDMSVTESERGQIFCNHCEGLLKTKLAYGMMNVANVYGDERQEMMARFAALPVPPLAPYAWLEDSYKFIRRSARP